MCVRESLLGLLYFSRKPNCFDVFKYEHGKSMSFSSTYQGRSSSEKTTPCSGSAPYRQLPRPASVTSSCGTAPGSHSTSTGDRRRNVGPAARESGTVTSFQTAPSTSMTNKVSV